MRLNRWIKIQLAIFTVVTVVAGSVMFFQYINVPALFGIGRYTVTVELPRAGGLYKGANVTYRGTEVGKVTAVGLTDSGVNATLSLRSATPIPGDLEAQVHSTSAIGEQFVALLPRSETAPALKNGDVITLADSSVPPDIGTLLDAANRGLEAIPRDSLRTVIDEGAVAIGGLGPELARIVNGSTQLASDARKNLDPILALIDESKPVLDSQADSAGAIRAWAAHLSDLTSQLKTNDQSVSGLIEQGATAADEAQQLMDRLNPSLPMLMANMASIGQLALTYQPAVEQLLVLLPMGVQVMAAGSVANRDSKHPGLVLSFNLNLNLPPPCTTGYLPAQQQRVPTMVDTPDRPVDDLYCRIPQDSWMAVRGARNLPCLTKPGKRAPTAKMCKSDEEYVPLNDGFNWKGDPNGTLSGQDIPQKPPSADVPPIAAAFYDPSSGTYQGPDGRVYTQSDLAPSNGPKTVESMLLPGDN